MGLIKKATDNKGLSRLWYKGKKEEEEDKKKPRTAAAKRKAQRKSQTKRIQKAAKERQTKRDFAPPRKGTAAGTTKMINGVQHYWKPLARKWERVGVSRSNDPADLADEKKEQGLTKALKTQKKKRDRETLEAQSRSEKLKIGSNERLYKLQRDLGGPPGEEQYNRWTGKRKKTDTNENKDTNKTPDSNTQVKKQVEAKTQETPGQKADKIQKRINDQKNTPLMKRGGKRRQLEAKIRKLREEEKKRKGSSAYTP